MYRVNVVLIIFAIFVRSVAANETGTDWKQHVIPANERSFNFKTVAKGTVPVHRFILQNPLVEPIRIEAITTTCTCTTIDFDVTDEEQSVLQTYAEAVIPVRLRGDMFDGMRNSTITVFFAEPHRAEIQLHVRGDIRADLNIVPRDFIDFGNVEPGNSPSRTLTVTYTGPNTQWRIVAVNCESEFIRTSITSESFVGRKVFKINVRLDESTPHGSLNTLLMLYSNDSSTRREIPIPIRATVGTVITVSPPHLSLGVLVPGEASSMKNVLLRGTKPFRITKIECDNPAIEIPLKIDADAPPKTWYSVPVVYRNPIEGAGSPRDGVLQAAVRITTDSPGLTPAFYVTARVRE